MKEKVIANEYKIESEPFWQKVIKTQSQQGTHLKVEHLEDKKSGLCRVDYTEED